MTRKTRIQAVKDGDEFYYTGTPCNRGHKSKRFTLGEMATGKKRSKCVQCWVEDNPQKPKVRGDLGILGNYY